MKSRLFKRVISFTLAACFYVTAFYTAVSAAPSGVITETANIGGGSANLVYIDMSVSGRTGEVVMSSQLSPSEASGLIGAVSDGNVVAAMNGGFFDAYYKPASVSFPDNFPRIYGTVINDGEILNGGDIGNAAALVFDSSGKPSIGYADIKAYYEVNGSRRQRIGDGVNSIKSYCYTDVMKAPVHVAEGRSVTYIKNGIVSNTVTSSGVNVAVPQDTMIILDDSSLQSGDSVRLVYDALLDGQEVDARTVITCGPMLLSKGQNVSMSGLSSYDEKQSASAVNQKSFAAISPDGRLILGEVTSSSNAIAEFLKSKGIKDAMCFDGGASSMLYVSGAGYKQSAGRKLASLFAIVDKKQVNAGISATPSKSAVRVNGNYASIAAYNIDGNNYFKLRDIASLLKGTNAEFDIGWDGAEKIVTINKGTYSGEPQISSSASPSSAVKSASKIIIEGKPADFTVYSIDGNNYFKLRDIADYLGIQITWDANTSEINITA